MFEDLSPTLPPYTSQILHGLLKAHDIPLGLSEKSPPAIYENFDCYAYPPQALTPWLLAYDNVTYFLNHPTTANDRRVCFLLVDQDQQPLALLVQLAEIDATIAKRLRKYLRQHELTTVAEILEDVKLLTLFKQLYTKIHVLFLGASADESLIQQLRIPIQNAYSGKIQLDFKTMAAVNPSIILAEDCLTMLMQGETRETSSVDAFCRHREQCVRALLSTLQDIEAQHEAVYKCVIDQLTAIMKYLQLQQLRSQQYGLTSINSNDLEQILAIDIQAKQMVYQNQDVNLEAGLLHLDIVPLIQMLALKDQSDALLRQLQQAHNHHYQELKAWEKDVEDRIAQQNQHWLPFLKRQGRKTIALIYHYSFIQLGVELVPWLGFSLAKVVPAAWIANVKALIQNIVKGTVFLFTLSPHLAQQSYEIIGRQLNHTNVTCALKVAGAGTGLVLTYATGSYALLRMISIGSLALQLNYSLQKSLLNDEKAIVKSHLMGFKPTPMACFYLMNIGLTLLETAYWQNVQPLVRTGGGLSGSLALAAIVRHKFLDTYFHRELSAEDSRFILFLCSCAGYELGYSFTQFSYESILSFMAQRQAREQAIAHLQDFEAQGQLSELSIEQPSLITTFRHWLNQENPLTFEWRNPYGFFYSADCQIRSYSEPEIQQELVCHITALPPRLTGSS